MTQQPDTIANAVFFATPAEFRAWLEAHHASARELWVGYRKQGSGLPSMTWPESVDEALCFGWIDGVRRRIDDQSYAIRFTPRKPRSTWSAMNISRARALIEEGRMRLAGLAAFEARSVEHSERYSYEQRGTATLDPAEEQAFRANQAAWAFFESRPASYRSAAIWWVVSAKRPETRLKRLTTLIDDSAQGRRSRS